MLNKKLVLATAFGAIVFGATAFAGGPGEYASAPSVAGLYLEGNVGYAWRNWEDMYYWKEANVVGGATPSSWDSNSKGGFAAIVDAGYQFNEYFSLEAGWIYLTPPKSLIGSGDGFNLHDGSTWTLYFGGKLQAPIYDDQTFIFGKLAAAYNRNSFRNSYQIYNPRRHADISSNYWSPLFAAGIQRYFTPNLSANIQYTFIPAYTDASSFVVTSGPSDFNVPQSNILTVGVGYKFLM